MINIDKAHKTITLNHANVKSANTFIALVIVVAFISPVKKKDNSEDMSVAINPPLMIRNIVLLRSSFNGKLKKTLVTK